MPIGRIVRGAYALQTPSTRRRTGRKAFDSRENSNTKWSMAKPITTHERYHAALKSPWCRGGLDIGNEGKLGARGIYGLE